MYKNDKVIRQYSEPFKLKILAELTTGKHTKSEVLIFLSLGYETIKINLKKVPNKIFLIPKILELEEVVVSSKKEMNNTLNTEN